MKGNPKVLKALNELLTSELTAINQYYVHFKMCENWGYARMAEAQKQLSMGEMKDADQVIERILFLEGLPNMQRLNPIKVGENVPEQLQIGLEIELAQVEFLNKAVALCRDEGDNGTREILETMLRDEEEHVDWLEAQLGIVEEIGKDNYLAEQIKS